LFLAEPAGAKRGGSATVEEAMSLLDDLGFRPARVGIAIILILLAGMAFTSWRNARIDALARSAMDATSAPTAVKKLASYKGERAGELLLVVASAAPVEQNRLAALQALVARKDVARVSRLSELILPTENFEFRQALANAIYQTGCSLDCVKHILYFQERMWRGDRPAEESRAKPAPGLSEKEQELQTALDEILRKNKPALGVVLEKTYGLNTLFPNPFAIEVVTRLGVTEACPLLMKTYLSVNEDVRASAEYRNVADAVEKLGCKSRPIPSQP